MIVLESVQAIREAFALGEISAREAATALGGTKVQKPWHTKEWRERRGRLLSDKCAQCGTAESPFVLQHLWQPRKLSDIAKDVRYRIRPQYEADHPIPQDPIPEPDLTSDACPKCQHLSNYWRKTTQDWRCGNTKCKHIFAIPVNIPVHSHEQMTSWRERQNELKQDWYESFREASFFLVIISVLALVLSRGLPAKAIKNQPSRA